MADCGFRFGDPKSANNQPRFVTSGLFPGTLKRLGMWHLQSKVMAMKSLKIVVRVAGFALLGLALIWGSAYLVVLAEEAAENEAAEKVAAKPAVRVTPIEVKEANASTEAEMKPYKEVIEHTEEVIEMVPIPGGKFLMGSPENEPGRKDDEGPQHEVEIEPFWMAKFEIPWDVYEIWTTDMDITRRELAGTEANERDKAAEEFTISKPTKPYTDMTFGMGKKGYPAICMTQHSARVFCQWLSMKTGRYYRLPTEAEWEYACRAGTTTAYSFGDDPAELDEYAWYTENSEDKYQKIGQKKPNPWGLHDMHGNVAEWVLDEHNKDFYKKGDIKVVKNPLCIPMVEYPRVVRGGSWDNKPAKLRSAYREGSAEEWKEQDPNLPQSIWYFTDALHVGFRIVRPLREPSEEEKAEKWDRSEPPQLDKEDPE
jgi:formylglycine-generating enzyme required for sulfatase activity